MVYRWRKCLVKGYFLVSVDMVLNGNAYNEKLGCEYDVQAALLNKGA